MTNYLIRTIEHNGQPFTDVTKIRENETYQVVEAESKEEAEEKIERPKGLLEIIPSSFNNGPISRALRNANMNSGMERGVSPSLTNEQVQKLIELSGRKNSE